MNPIAPDPHEEFRARLVSAVADLAMVDPESVTQLDGEVPVGRQRRRLGSRLDDNVGTLLLVERDGVLSWETGTAPRLRRGYRRGRRGGVAAGEVVAQLKFEHLPASKVSKFLADLDLKLTPGHVGAPLREMKNDGTFAPVGMPAAEGRVLLLVHGTFSRCDAMIEELRSHPEGARFLADLPKRYGQVLAFDHRTVGVSPMLNAVDLARRFAGSHATVDIISHSRGGLVSHWWSRALPAGTATPGRIVCVASPLGGTSLAAPPRLRSALGLLTNFGRALGGAMAAVPFLQAGAGLMRLCAGALSVGASTPLVDAAVAMIPGLSAQAREGHNPELIELRRCAPGPGPVYFAISSNFEPTADAWKFWEWFRKDRLADLGADLVFDGPNDLVVDTASMRELADGVLIDPANLHDFDTNPAVHHCNYFAQPKTVDKLRLWLQVP